MKTFSNRYIFVFSSVMVIIVAALLSFIAMHLQPLQDKNIRIERKLSILDAMNIESDKEEADEKFEKHIVNSYSVNSKGNKKQSIKAFEIKFEEELDKPAKERLYPVFIGQTVNDNKVFIFPLHGKGLWGPIFGYISLEDDLKTINGVVFDHDDETPGLGAEISTEEFQQQFNNKKIVDQNDQYTGVQVVKGGAMPDNVNAVDGLSGATITSDGVEAMIDTCLNYYKPFIKKVRNE